MSFPDRALERFLQAIPDAAVAVADDGTIARANSRAESLFGYPADTLRGRPLALLIAEGGGATPGLGLATFFAHGHRPAMADGRRVAGLRADGTEFPAECFLSLVEAEGGPYALAVVRDVTERRCAEQARRDGEARYRQLFEANPHPMWVYDLGTLAFLAVNDAAVRNYGYSRNEFLAMTIADIRPPEDADRLRETVARVTGGVDVAGTWRHLKKGGAVVEVEIVSHTLDWGGRRAELVLAQDVTARRRSEEALQESARRLDFMMSNSPAVVYACRPSGDFGATFITRNVVHQLGYDPQEFLADPDFWKAHIHPHDAPWVLAGMAALPAEGSDTHEYRFRHRDGTWRWMHDDLKLIRDEAGDPVEIIGSWIDITDRKQAEQALEESERTYRALFDSATDAIFVLDLDGNFIDVNKTAYTRLGYTKQEMLSLHIGSLDSPDFAARVPERLADVSRRGEAVFESAHTRKDGSVMPVEVNCRLLEYQGRQVYFSVIRDITERKQAESELRAREEQLRVIFDASPGIILVDPQGTIVFANHRMAEMFGLDLAKLIGTQYPEHLHESERAAGNERMRRLIRGEIQSVSTERRYIRADGTGFWGYLTGRRLENPDGTLRALVGVVADITERKQAEEERETLQVQLAHAQKMEAVGRLAGGVAHDFNNMLAVILGRAELALRRAGSDGRLRQDLGEIIQAAERSALLTRQLLAFARRQTASPQVLDLNGAVGGTLQMLRRLIGENIDLAWLPGAGLWNVRLDPSQLDQLLANLVVNARDAIADTGRITLETRNVALAEAPSARNEGFTPGEYVLFSVSDEGCGMDEETLTHVFEPFFSTKGPGQGTGLGLATVYGIVRQNGGFIDAQSEPEKGTTFRIYLPRVRADGAANEQGVGIDTPRGGHETVLFVEDEEAILALGREMLEGLGYEVLSAGSPGEALRVAKEHARKIHLLVTDVVMPEMNGRELAERLTAARPGLWCLFISGYNADATIHRGVLDEAVLLLEKPFSVGQLASKVREALEGKVGTRGEGRGSGRIPALPSS